MGASRGARLRRENAAKLTARIVEEVSRAIALHATWARCSGQPDPSFDQEAAFPVIRDALLIDLTMTLCRLHEVGQDASATFPRLLRSVEDPAVGAHLPHPADYGLAKERFDHLQASGALKRLRDLRDRVLAHNDTRGVAAGPIQGDATQLVNASLDLAVLLSRAVTGDEPPLATLRHSWDLAADRFWTRASGNSHR